MNRCTAITSMTEKGYHAYGKRFLETFREYWHVPLVIYVEGAETPKWDRHSDLMSFYFLENVPDWKHFENMTKPFPIMRGIVDEGQYSIYYDSHMGRKAFMQADAAKRLGGKIFWIDSDVVTFSDVPPDFLDTVLPDDKMCCYLGRTGGPHPQDGGPIPHTESGFIGFNANHPLCSTFLGAYTAIFLEGLIFTRKGWHDCAAFDMTRAAFDPELFNDLGWRAGIKAPHVFINSVLGKYMDHLKGPRKGVGHSYAKDLEVERTEPYWQKIINDSKPESQPDTP